ncbi:uncharacterized protein DUF3221 [Planomicrobium soli]|uniref:Uncharacterized protein DUF3221 n=1 Tax=Planomicrobium soli TaxID=1176648 RepID=A0A2P8GQU1_9BACL|nr:DUF3221 domain-containing protein [Planomicrobium soli]PSL36346.1 uncharacterized protein DUF3221 [Planomicrobium soli]
MKALKCLFVVLLILISSACSKPTEALVESPYPATDIISEEPAFTGYIVGVIEDKQTLLVINGISKEEAMDINPSNTLGVITFYSNFTNFDGAFRVGNKVAIWESKESAENTLGIAQRIVLLEE